MQTPRIIIAALRGGSGKTAVSVGIARAWQRRNLDVAAFKKGPDYIDAAWLRHATHSPCYNLDTFLMNEQCVCNSFVKHADGADVAVIEGARGLFDGMDQQGSYSTAALSALLNAPVVLVVDCSKITRTAAALVLGCMHFDPDVTISGVILNQVARPRHEEILRTSIESTCGIPVLGCLPRLKDFPFRERHLGLIPPQEHGTVDAAIDELADNADEHIDMDALMDLASTAPALAPQKAPDMHRMPARGNRPRIGVLRDTAFQFYYPENLESLMEMGADIVEVSALSHSELPEIHALYIGGGFPETHAQQLADNTVFRASLKKRIDDGLPVYAECGGAMYLGRSLVLDGTEYPMVDAIPVVYGISARPRGHGYTIIDVVEPNPFFEKGAVLRGHEFHYSYVLDWEPENFDMAFKLQRGYGFDGAFDGVCRGNVLAAYSHVHATGEKGWAAGLIKCARKFQHQHTESAHTELENTVGRHFEKKVVGRS